MARPKGNVVSNLIDVDLQEYEPAEEPEEARKPAPKLEEVRSARGTDTGRRSGSGGSGVRPRSEITLPHPPGPAGLSVPRTRLWIKRPPGPAGL